MKVSREQAARNRAHVVEVAAAAFRQHGFAGIGVADLMQSAGLTHGGFYKSFASKDALAVEASAAAVAATGARVHEAIAGADHPLAAFADYYLSERHRDAVSEGCVLATLAPEASRAGPELRATFQRAIEGYLADLGEIVPGEDDGARRAAAMATLATAIGGLILARTVLDPVLSQDLLAAARGAIVATEK
jgi:TetR/AcrR family transcriptional regulator, transcriptional repressor for nem operon